MAQTFHRMIFFVTLLLTLCFLSLSIPTTGKAVSFPGHSIDAAWKVGQDSESVTINVNYTNTGPHAQVTEIRAVLLYQNKNIWSVNSPRVKLGIGKATIPLTIRRINQGPPKFNSDQIVIQMLAGDVLSYKIIPYKRSWNTSTYSSQNQENPSSFSTDKISYLGGVWTILGTDTKNNEQHSIILKLNPYENNSNRYIANAYKDLQGQAGDEWARGEATSLNNQLTINMKTKNGNSISGTLRILNKYQMDGTLSMHWTRLGNTSRLQWSAKKQ